MRDPVRWLLVVVTILLLPARAGAAQQHVALGDDQIRQRVAHRLSEKEIAGVEVLVAGGVVTLRGNVASLWAQQEAVEQARKTEDVQSVVSELAIAGGENDDQIARDIASRIRRYVFYTIFDDADIAVNNGVVTLTGRVTMPYKAEALADLASRVSGVREIDNRIEILPTSIYDDQLRYAIARQIYGDPLFANYAVQAQPPIHVIVERGRVTLSGVVLSEVERRKAETIARATFGVMAVENRLRIERGH